MDLHQMEYFVAVCDYGGITPAAEALFLTPQALSKSIRKLEEELAAPLFSREKSGLALTPVGEKALEEIRRLTNEYHTVALRLKHISAQEKGRIRLACAFSVPNALPLEKLREDLRPNGLYLDLMELPDLLAEEMVQREVVDLGLTIGLPQNPELFQCTFLRRFRLCAVVNRRHPFSSRNSISVRDLAGEKVITKSPYFNSYHIIEQEAQRQGIKLSYALQSPDEIRFLQLIENNEGIGVGITFMGVPELFIARDAVLLPFEEELPWEIYLITRKGHYLSPTVQKLAERLKTWKEKDE